MKRIVLVALLCLGSLPVWSQVEFVDMGLSVKWATCNVDASKPEEYGSLLTFDKLSSVRKANRKVPTDSEWTELRVYCSWKWTTINGVGGMIVTSQKTGNSLFLPAGGTRYLDGSLSAQGVIGCYWSSTAYCFTDKAWSVFFSYGSDGVDRELNYRSRGFSVRLVTGY